MREELADTIHGTLHRQAAERPSDTAVIAGDVSLTFGELDAQVRAFAAGLDRLGLSEGATVGLLCTNRVEWLVSALGTMAAASRVALFNTWSKAWDLDHLLRHSACDALVSLRGFRDVDFVPLLRDLLPEAWDAPAPGWRSAAYPHLRELILVDGGDATGGWRRYEDVLRLPSGRDEGNPPPPVAGRATAFVLYTSGSTARPKAVPLQHRAAVEHGFDVGERMGVRPGDRIWLPVPLFWSYGGANALPVALTHGCTLVLQEAFDAAEAVELIERTGCTVAYTLPNITNGVLASPAFSPERVASLERGITIGSAQDVRATAERFGISGVCNAYGSTEIYGGCCVTPHDWPLDERVGCQGPPLPGIRLTIRDPETGRPLPAGEIGEITVSGHVTTGYLGEPEANERAFTPEGEYRSGDLGHLDADGNLYFAGRATEMIKSGGINISPLEVEDFLLTHDAVREAAVVGVDDPDKEQVAVAYVRVDEGAVIDEAALRDYCRQRIASFKVPARVVVCTSDLPKTDTGKLAKQRIRELAQKLWDDART